MANCAACGRSVPAQRARCIYCGGDPITSAKAALNCPRCLIPMERVDLGPIAVDSCAQCAAAWYDRVELEVHLSTPALDPWLRAARPYLESGGTKSSRLDSPSNLPAVYLPCPRCGERMQRRALARGVVVDRCRAHGVFADAAHLEVLRQQAQAVATELKLSPEASAVRAVAQPMSTTDLIIDFTGYLVWCFFLSDE